ncbi:MAG TPA: DUF4912 domain-containing protein [Methylomirabilota bacterium]|nr:DUF4912 domain-containing protein [Methylomirabilota bacterium]
MSPDKKPKKTARSSAKPAEAASDKSPAKAPGADQQTPAKSAQAAAPTPPLEGAKPAKQPRAAKPKTLPKSELPPILLEGDVTNVSRPSGPGTRYALGVTRPLEDLGELPEGYGTKRISLTARDPHWLYASWDLTSEQLRALNAQSSEGHLVVRVFRNRVGTKPVAEVQVHPESRNWFIYVGQSETKFLAELGFYSKGEGEWTTVATSNATITPPDTLSDDTSVQFATIPTEVSFRQLLSAVQEAAREHVPLVEAIRQLREAGHTNLPEQPNLPPAQWTEAQSQALAAVLTMDQVRRVWIGSLEVTELIRRRLAKDISSMAAAQLAEKAQLGALSSEALSSVSSAFGGMPARKGFWFNVNAELIIYGATEPDATVTIGGRQIRLRQDGSFSFRFALPDGNFSLPAQATAADGHDSRSAHLQFKRATDYIGQVDAHPQDPSLRTPRPEHTA